MAESSGTVARLGRPALAAGMLALALSACGGDRPAPPPPALSQQIVEVEGVPVTVLWRRDLPVRAEASGLIPPDRAAAYASDAILRATGCRAETDEATDGQSIVVGEDGVLRIALPINCAAPVAAARPAPETIATTAVPPPGGAPQTAIAAADPTMAAAVERAVRQVLADRAPSAPAPAPAAAAPAPAAPSPEPAAQPGAAPPRPAPELYEGSPYAAFTPAEIQAYCDQGWDTRIAPNGRTEYNPCTRRDAFR